MGSEMADAVIYIRTSSDGQLDGHGPEIQEAAAQDYASRVGLRVVGVLTESITGTTANRPVYREAIASLQQSEIDAVIVSDASRLARDLVVQELLLAETWAAGGEVHAADTGLIHPDDPDNPTRTLMRQMLGALAQWQKAELVSRLRRARRASAPVGLTENVGQKRFGLKDAREATVLSHMLGAWRAGCSTEAIAYDLNLRPGWHTRTGTNWTPRNVARVLRQETT